MGNRIVYTTESAGNPIKSSPLCKHGKDAGQTCYPCEYWNELDAQWNDVDRGDIHYASFGV